MITSTDIYERGKLGNQLFVCAMLLAIKHELKHEIRIPNFEGQWFAGQDNLLSNFNLSDSIAILTEEEKSKIQYDYYEDSKDLGCYRFNPGVFWIPDWTNIHGWFQNYEYFQKHENLIIPELMPKQHIIESNLETLNKIKSKYPGYEIVSLNLRKGDIENYGLKIKMYGDNPDVLDVNSRWHQYFLRSKGYFKNKKVKFFVFAGGLQIPDQKVDSDYEWCKRNLVGDEYIFEDYDRNTINDLTLMVLCDHHILSAISTFSWMVGFLNANKDKVIVAPRKYYFFENEMNYGFYPYNVITV